MIVQFFPRINFVEGLAYSVNTTGALEIIPKPSGMGIFTRPTILSTHAVKDEFLTSEEYDTNGLRRMLTDQGFECVMIEHSLHGRYIQVGKQKRDGYTRYLENYQNPSEWNPPRPWSCRIKGRVLQVLELCIPTPTEKHMCFQGKTPPTDIGTPVIAPLPFSSRIQFLDVMASDVIRTNTKAHRRVAGTVEISSDDPTKHGLSFTKNISVALENSDPARAYANLWKTLADELVDSSVAESKTLIPAPSSLIGRYLGMVYCLPFPNGVSYVGVKRDKDGRVVDWKKFEVGAFERYGGVGRLTNNGKTSTFPILTNDITAFKEWKDDTTGWVQGVEHYRTCRTECLFEWPVVVYTLTYGESAVKNGANVLTDDEYASCRPLCFVPLMVRFVPADGYRGPIDHKSGRRLCMGSAIFAFVCTDTPTKWYSDRTVITLSMVQIRWPITKQPIFNETFDLATSLANYTNVPTPQVAKEVSDYGSVLESKVEAVYTLAEDEVVRRLYPGFIGLLGRYGAMKTLSTWKVEPIFYKEFTLLVSRAHTAWWMGLTADFKSRTDDETSKELITDAGIGKYLADFAETQYESIKKLKNAGDFVVFLAKNPVACNIFLSNVSRSFGADIMLQTKEWVHMGVIHAIPESCLEQYVALLPDSVRVKLPTIIYRKLGLVDYADYNAKTTSADRRALFRQKNDGKSP